MPWWQTVVSSGSMSLRLCTNLETRRPSALGMALHRRDLAILVLVPSEDGLQLVRLMSREAVPSPRFGYKGSKI